MNKLMKFPKVILTIVMMLCVALPTLAHDFEVGGIYYNYLDKTAKTVEVTYEGSSFSYSNEYTGAVAIPSSVTYNSTTYSVTEIGDGAFFGCSGLTSITIPNSVTTISDHAFSGCSGLTSITIPNSVTEIGDRAFYECRGLTELIIENGKETLLLGCNDFNSYYIGEGLFYDCPLEKLYIGRNLNYDSGEWYGYSPFYSKTKLKEITIANSVISIGENAFRSCSGLTSVTIPNSVISIGENAFSGCTNLAEVTIGNSVTSIGGNAFYITGWYNNQPDGILYLDNYCLGNKGNKPIGTLLLKDGTRLICDWAFYGCSGLTSITIPNSVTEIGDGAFDDCSGLTELIIEDGKEILSLGYNYYDSTGEGLFYDCLLEKLYLGRNLSYETSKSYGYSPFYRKTTLKEVTIGNSVTEIGYCAFYGCSGLTSITIPNSVTEIGYYAFDGCTGLTSITIPNSVTEIGNYAFYDCSNLKLVINLSNLTFSKGSSYYGYVAYYANKVINAPNGCVVGDFVWYKKPEINILGGYLGDATKLTLPTNFNGEYYVIGPRVFYGHSGLTSITIPNSVTSIGDSAFYNCSGLTSVTIPNSVTSIGDHAFYGCSNIHSFTISSGISSISSNTFSVKPKKTIWLTNTPPSGSSYASGTVNYVANEQYSSLSNVVVYPYLSSMFEVDGVKYVPVSPSERTCDAIDCTYNPTDTIINIGNTVTFKGVAMTVKEINPYICYGNSHIKECKIDYNGNIHNYAFYGCSAIENATINANSIGNYAFNGCTAIENATINAETIGISAFENSATKTPATFSIDTKSISDYAFNDCSAIETITLREGLETIGNSAFSGCSKLKEVVIPNSATSLGESAFYGCSSITSATIGNAVENINASTFYNCKSLENIIIGNEVKSIGKNSFYGCSTLPIIEIPKNVTSIGDYAFDNCSNLSDVIIEDRDTVLTLGPNGSSPMFSDCPLDSVYIGGDISYKTTSSYGYSPFYNNKTLRAVTITDKETEISDNEFYGCANLKSVSIGDGVETIGKYAFSGCASLESFAFGSSMKTIGEEAFSDCTALVKLHSKAMTPPVCGTQALDDINKWNCELYVPGTSISAYQAADQWKEFFFMYDGVEGVKMDCNAIEVSRYDIHGRLLSEPARGINIIKMSDGTTRKEIVKE